MISVVADDKIPFLKGVLEPYASVRYMDGRQIDHAAVEKADALIVRTRTLCNKSLLQGSRVKFVATATIGFDHIDTAYCDAHDIRWVNAPGCNAASVQQYIASVLATLSVNCDFPLAGKTIGIVGVGHVGKMVETLARLLGMRVLLNDPPRARSERDLGFVSLEKLLTESDIVTLHVPLNITGEDNSFHLINEHTLRMFKDGAWLINTSRGEVADNHDLKNGLSAGKLKGAIIDVWENEPEIDMELMDKVIIATPHIAGYSADGKKNGTVHVVRALGQHFKLPLTTWEPSEMPLPSAHEIILDCQNQQLEKVVCKAILHTYDVMEDDARFRTNPGGFEGQRGHYPVRREFPAYQIKLINSNPGTEKVLEQFGFSALENVDNK
jgi:erythronate-4-phosphate dehydrogenase